MTCASFAAPFAGASLSVTRASPAGTMAMMRRPVAIAVACSSGPDTGFTVMRPSSSHTSHWGGAPSRRWMISDSVIDSFASETALHGAHVVGGFAEQKTVQNELRSANTYLGAQAEIVGFFSGEVVDHRLHLAIADRGQVHHPRGIAILLSQLLQV